MPFKITYIQVLLVIGGAIIGFALNYLANKIANDKLFKQLKAEIDAIKSKQQTSRLSAQENEYLLQLQGALTILNKKL